MITLETTRININTDHINTKYFNDNRIFKIKTSMFDGAQYKKICQELKNQGFVYDVYRNDSLIFATNGTEKPDIKCTMSYQSELNAAVILNLMLRQFLEPRHSLGNIYDITKSWPRFYQILKKEKNCIRCLSYRFKLENDAIINLEQTSFTVIPYKSYLSKFKKPKYKQRYSLKDGNLISDSKGFWVQSAISPNEKTINTAVDIYKDGRNKLECRTFFAKVFNKKFQSYLNKPLCFEQQNFETIQLTKDNSDAIDLISSGVFLFDTTSTLALKDTMQPFQQKITQIFNVEEAKNKPLIIVTHPKDYYIQNKISDPKIFIYQSRKGMPTQTKTTKDFKKVTLKKCVQELIFKQACINNRVPKKYKINGDWTFKAIKKRTLIDGGIDEEKYVLTGSGQDITKNKHYQFTSTKEETVKSKSYWLFKFDDKTLKVEQTKVQVSPLGSEHAEHKRIIKHGNATNLNEYRNDLIRFCAERRQDKYLCNFMDILMSTKQCEDITYPRIKAIAAKKGFRFRQTNSMKEMFAHVGLVMSIQRVGGTSYVDASQHTKISECRNYIVLGRRDVPDQKTESFNRLYKLTGDDEAKDVFIKLITIEGIRDGFSSIMTVFEKIARAKQDYKNTIKPTSSIASG